MKRLRYLPAASVLIVTACVCVLWLYHDEPVQAADVTPTVEAVVVEMPDIEAPDVEQTAQSTTLYTSIGEYKITGYVPTCKHCCGKMNGITASGVKATVGKTVAIKGLGFGTQVYISGLGFYTVEDRGVGNGIVDVACATHKDCYAITSNREVYLVEEGVASD